MSDVAGGWRYCTPPDTHPYYFNLQTQETQWEVPNGFNVEDIPYYSHEDEVAIYGEAAEAEAVAEAEAEAEGAEYGETMGEGEGEGGGTTGWGAVNGAIEVEEVASEAPRALEGAEGTAASSVHAVAYSSGVSGYEGTETAAAVAGEATPIAANGYGQAVVRSSATAEDLPMASVQHFSVRKRSVTTTATSRLPRKSIRVKEEGKNGAATPVGTEAAATDATAAAAVPQRRIRTRGRRKTVTEDARRASTRKSMYRDPRLLEQMSLEDYAMSVGQSGHVSKVRAIYEEMLKREREIDITRTVSDRPLHGTRTAEMNGLWV